VDYCLKLIIIIKLWNLQPVEKFSTRRLVPGDKFGFELGMRVIGGLYTAYKRGLSALIHIR
jgi:hypothetical protein